MGRKILELFTISTNKPGVDWQSVVDDQQECRYIGKRCDKRRKSAPEIAIGTCSVGYGVKEELRIIICPHRLLERRQIFMDSVHLLTKHEPGNELHVVAEQSVPGGSVDYFLVSARNRKVIDFVGIELQTMDTTGTAWPQRQLFLKAKGVTGLGKFDETKSYGMNWKMTAKTTLVQLHHKIETFEHLGKHLVLVLQDCLIDYMRREFTFNHLVGARLGDSMHFHAYRFAQHGQNYSLELASRLSTDASGVAECLGIKTSAKVELSLLVNALERAISPSTLLTV